jgi:hypothetical protein
MVRLRGMAFNHKLHIYLEFNSVCPLARIGTPHTPSPPNECVPPPRNQRGGAHSPAGEEVGVLIGTTGEKA